VRYTEWLIARARNEYWRFNEPLPLDLFAEMQAAGLDVAALEMKYLNQDN
jgi:hypothetical protein